MTGAKINYTCVETEDGLTVCVMQEGTKKDYPRQRIVRQFIERQNKPESDSSDSMLSSGVIPGLDVLTP